MFCQGKYVSGISQRNTMGEKQPGVCMIEEGVEGVEGVVYHHTVYKTKPPQIKQHESL